jgi:hypothetical protein
MQSAFQCAKAESLRSRCAAGQNDTARPFGKSVGGVKLIPMCLLSAAAALAGCSVNKSATQSQSAAQSQASLQTQSDGKRAAAHAEVQHLIANMRGKSPELLERFEVPQPFVRLYASSGASHPPRTIPFAENHTDRIVTRVRFRATLLTPGREIAWKESDFEYMVPGGIEPGESRRLLLREGLLEVPDARVFDRADCFFIVRPVALHGVDGEAFAVCDLTWQEARLLQTRLQEFDVDDEAMLRSEMEAWMQQHTQRTMEMCASIAKMERQELAEKQSQSAAAKLFIDNEKLTLHDAKTSKKATLSFRVKNNSEKVIHNLSLFVDVSRKNPDGSTTLFVRSAQCFKRIENGLAPGQSMNLEITEHDSDTLHLMSWPRDEGQESLDHLKLSVFAHNAFDSTQTPLFQASPDRLQQERLATLEALIAKFGW